MKRLWVILLTLPLQVKAADGIDTLVVTAKAQSDITNAKKIEVGELISGARNDAAELLQGIAGVQADSRSNYAQDTRVTLRGFGARSAFGVRGVDLQIDGIPLTMPDGQGQFSGVMLDGVDQINVLSGPIAALYGNAAGGVISLQTSAPTSNRILIGGAMDEAGLARQQILGELQKDNMALRVRANNVNVTGDRPHASAERDQLGLQAYYHFDNGIQAQLRFDKENAPLLQDPLGLTQVQWEENPLQANSSAEFFNTRKSIEHQQNALSFRQSEGDQRWQFAAWQGDRHIQQYLAQKGDALANSGGVVDLSRDFSGVNGNYTWDFSVANQPANFTLGGEWTTMDDRRKGFVNNNGLSGDLRRDELGQVDSHDIYTIVQWQLSQSWQWLAGLRQSHMQFNVDDYFIIPSKNADDSGEKNFNHLAKTLATRYQINDQWVIHAAIGNGFETPTLTEAAYTTGDKGFNQTLDAAHNQQQELGVDYRFKRLDLSLTSYRIKTIDEIVVDQSLNGRTSYLNTGATQRKGVEFSGRYEWSPVINTRFSANYIDAEYTQGQWSDSKLPGIARVIEYLQCNARPFSNDYLNVGVSLLHRSPIATNDDNHVKAPAYTTVDISLSGSLPLSEKKSTEWSSDWWVKWANVTNEKYVGSVIVNQTNGRAFEPAPGRNLSIGLTMKYGF